MGMASYIMTTSDKENPEFKDLYLFHGKSAYQAAVEQGFVGTEEEWLAGLTELRFGTQTTFKDKDDRLIYIDLETNNIFRYDKSNDKFQAIGGVLGETSETAYRGDRGKIAYDHAISKHDYLPLAGGDMIGDIKVLNIIPATDITYSLGSESKTFASIYASNIRAYRNGYRYGSINIDAIGSATAVGIGALYLGNATAEGNTGNAIGKMYIYGKGTGYTGISAGNDGDTNVNITLPSKSGVLALATDIPDSAATLTTARTIAISGKATGTATSFDGSQDISIPITAIDPTGITQSESYRMVNDTQITAWNAKPTKTEVDTAISTAVTKAVSDIIDASPSTLDTLNELAAALGDDPNFATTMTNALASKLSLAGGFMTGDLNFAGSNSDRYITFYSTTDNTPAHSWRIGYLGSGSGNTNYFTIQSGGTTGTFENALRFGAETYDAEFGGNVLPLTNNAKNIGSSSMKWANVYATTFTGNLSGNANTSTTLATARTLTIGKTGKSFNGSSDVSWTLAEIGALPSAGGTLTGSISLTETKNILLRPNDASYTSGIGYDTNGNACIALWAKNTVTRLRWHAGVDMSNLTAGTMMGITPDFEISKASGTAIGYIAGNTIIHAGNYTSYCAKKSHTHSYLSTGGGSLSGDLNMNGHRITGIAGSYTATANLRYCNGALEIRENGLIGSDQSDIGYAPMIGFHWCNRVAASLAMSAGGVFTFIAQNGVDYAPIQSGNITSSGTITGTKTYNAVWNDYAEYYERGEETEPGDIIGLSLESDEEKYITAVNGDIVVGIHSDSYGHIIGGDNKPDDFKGNFEEYNEKNFIPVGMVGRVFCKVIGSIKKGDAIYASDIPGVGEAKNDNSCDASFVGYALQEYDSTKVGKIKVLLRK